MKIAGQQRRGSARESHVAEPETHRGDHTNIVFFSPELLANNVFLQC